MSDMRFRIYDNHTKELVGPKGLSFTFSEGRIDHFWHKVSDYEQRGNATHPLDQERYKVMQSTSLLDKNGCLIFEGDILKRMGKDYSIDPDFDADPDAEYPVIEIGRDVATMDRFPVYWLENESFGYEGEDLETPTEWEVIGNVHQHPELLSPE